MSDQSSSILHNLKGKLWISVFPIIGGIALLILKFYAFNLTNSQAIYSDALESIINVLTSFATLTVIIIAAKPADEDHPYGHGKAESMAATFEGGAITVAGLIIIYEAFHAFFKGEHVEEINLGLLLTIIAGTANGLMGWGMYIRGKKVHSEALISSGSHLMSDALTSIGVLLSLVLVKWTGRQWLDPLIAGVFGLTLCYSGLKILMRSGNVLLDGHDRQLLENLVALFKKERRPGVIHIHHTRVIRSGNFHHIECHMVVPEFWTIAESHDFSEGLEADILKDYPVGGELRIHLDPCRRVYCENCELEFCPIRQRPFVERHPLSLEIIIAPDEPV